MDKKLLEILACPSCKGKLIHDKKHKELICKAEGLAYEIKDQIPVMLVDEARKMSLDEVEALK